MVIRFGLALCAVLFAVTAQAKVLGNIGATYDIAEKDALVEIEARAKGIDWSEVLKRKSIEEYDGPEERVHLPRADRGRTYSVDMTYSLTMDVPDGRGGILYPQGYTFNPLDYVVLSRTLVVINGNDPDQVRWYAASAYRGRLDVMLLLTEGSYRKLGRKLDAPPYYADTRVIGRLQLAAVPSVIRQEGKMLLVEEIDVQQGASRNESRPAGHDGQRMKE